MTWQILSLILAAAGGLSAQTPEMKPVKDRLPRPFVLRDRGPTLKLKVSRFSRQPEIFDNLAYNRESSLAHV